jgi:hypothetical protein
MVGVAGEPAIPEVDGRGAVIVPPTYHDVYARWRDDPEAFWAEAGEAVHWYRRWDAVLDASRAPFYRWLPGGLGSHRLAASRWRSSVRQLGTTTSG